MAKNDQRVNLRIDTETYEAYEKIAKFFNYSVPEFMRESLQTAVPIMHTLGTLIDQAIAGDVDAMEKLTAAFWQVQRGQVDVAEITMATSLAEIRQTVEQKAAETESAAGRASNTSR